MKKWEDFIGESKEDVEYYKKIIEEFLQDIIDEGYDALIDNTTKSAGYRTKFEVVVKYKMDPIYSNEIEDLFETMDKQTFFYSLIKELLQRIRDCGHFDIDFAHFSSLNPNFNLTVRVK